ncbi:sigma-54-dependent Fis family transcriptional regulator [Limibaculum sp. M0105]|uniref:Nif-specific regulatory protein n=1 Tax=Thermohalobaculum xanthum TaxID=2753746 RepID=A0A8J7MAJ1_9RHOB|nr:sigma-54 dependent transcriptional regulator [Thermohalobaculum xanthum]MBK0400743.1 sigma-54-dependent Fis family transcriptional regulator [Thermohalobaculum xanthum]
MSAQIAPHVLLVEDDAMVRAALAQTLDLADIAVETAESAEVALQRLDPAWPGAVISDVRMPGKDGLALLDAVVAMDRELPVVMLTGEGDIPMAVRAMSAGAYDFLEKPCPPQRLIEVARRACHTRALVLENRALRAELAAAPGTVRLIGESAAAKRLREQIEKVAASGLDVLILGETGAGKEVAARMLHARSARAEGPFIAINCGALSPDLAGSELFGHEKGAFTGATARRIGRFEQAGGGTVFLDEIESMSLDLQVRLLRVLQERELERLGAERAIPIDVRVIAATKADLHAGAAEGRFRSDLTYRLDVARVAVPPLRERREDLAALFRHFVVEAASRAGQTAPQVPDALVAELAAHEWPGNVRELKNAAQRFALGLDWHASGTQSAEPAPDGTAATLVARMAAYEKSMLSDALRATGGHVPTACERLGTPRKTFYEKLARHGLKPDDFR